MSTGDDDAGFIGRLAFVQRKVRPNTDDIITDSGTVAASGAIFK
jgi:hypothetical protein